MTFDIATRAGAPRRRGSVRALGRKVAGILASVTAAGCTGIFSPRRDVHPALQQLTFDDLFSNLRTGGLVYVEGVPADAAFRLEVGRRVPIEVTASSGDREAVGLYRRYCPFTDRIQFGHFDCFRFVIYMQIGTDARTLARQVAAIGGRFDLISATGGIGGVTLFAPDGLIQSARSARSWPGVAHVTLSSEMCAPSTPACPGWSALELPLPVDTGAAVQGDGVLQVRPGDTLVASYRQPSGALLQALAVVP